MSVKIKLRTVVRLDESSLNDQMRGFYIELINALKEQMRFEHIDPNKHKWEHHRDQNSMLYRKTQLEINNLILGLYKVNRGFPVMTKARAGHEIDFSYKDVSIDQYDWNNTACFQMTFESNEYILRENFGSLLLLSQKEDMVDTLLLDIGVNESISISRYYV